MQAYLVLASSPQKTSTMPITICNASLGGEHACSTQQHLSTALHPLRQAGSGSPHHLLSLLMALQTTHSNPQVILAALCLHVDLPQRLLSCYDEAISPALGMGSSLYCICFYTARRWTFPSISAGCKRHKKMPACKIRKDSEAFLFFIKCQSCMVSEGPMRQKRILWCCCLAAASAFPGHRHSQGNTGFPEAGIQSHTMHRRHGT